MPSMYFVFVYFIFMQQYGICVSICVSKGQRFAPNEQTHQTET